MTEAFGFWSYTHDDDEDADGAIRRLADRLAREYRMLTGHSLELFVDRSALAWGDQWATRIEEALASTTFFIPVITPRYFESEACRRELLRFSGAARSMGVERLLLPLLFVDVSDLHDEDIRDEAVALIAQTQWEDWRDLRLVDESSSEHRRGVNRLALRLREIAEQLRDTPLDLPARHETGDEPTAMEYLAQFETEAPQWNKTIEEFGEEIQQLGSAGAEFQPLVEQAVERGASFAERLALLRRFARAMEGPAERIEELGRRYASQLVAMDPVLLMMFRLAADVSPDSEDAADVRRWLGAVLGMTKAQDETVGILRGLVEAMSPLENASREVRREVAKARSGLQGVIDGQAVFEGWRREADTLAEQFGIDPDSGAMV